MAKAPVGRAKRSTHSGSAMPRCWANGEKFADLVWKVSSCQILRLRTSRCSAGSRARAASISRRRSSPSPGMSARKRVPCPPARRPRVLPGLGGDHCGGPDRRRRDGWRPGATLGDPPADHAGAAKSAQKPPGVRPRRRRVIGSTAARKAAGAARGLQSTLSNYRFHAGAPCRQVRLLAKERHSAGGFCLTLSANLRVQIH